MFATALLSKKIQEIEIPKRRNTLFLQNVDGFIIPGIFSERAYKSVISYKPKPGDLFVATYPKCGTTWVLQIITLILHDGKMPKNFKELHQYSPFLEMCGMEALEHVKNPPIFKIHLPYHLTPKSADAKYIYIIRNPRDTCVSLYYHMKLLEPTFADATFDEFFEYFIRGEMIFGDYFDNLISWYPHRHDQNVLFLIYEEMKQDLPKAISKICNFLGPSYLEKLKNNEFLSMILERSSMKFMKEKVEKLMNPGMDVFKFVDDPEIPLGVKEIIEKCEKLSLYPATESKNTHKSVINGENQAGSFFRKGVVGDWKNHFSEKQLERFHLWFKQKTDGFDIEDLLNVWKSYGCF